MERAFYVVSTLFGFAVWFGLSDQLVAQAKTGEPISERVSFNRDIRPILSDKCFHCHGPDENTREAGLRFDQKKSAMRTIEPESPDESELLERILDEDPDYQMPPPDAHKPLEDSEVKLLELWIEQGAEWDEFWAYVPPKETPIADANKDWAINWIDQMVLARLESKSLKPNPKADRVTLVRRIYFDLIGLPPTPEQVDAFVKDESPEAFEKLVDSLLASEHFGERLAMYWLDLVRYADTVGYHGDQEQNISPYRDWVITAFNQNMPFDQFTREQLAGDLLGNPTRAQKIASGYNRLLQTTHEGGLQPKEYRAIYAADRVRNVSAVWMGATVGCAQCHDHKYDPYTAKDFYSLAAFFADIDDEQHFKDGTNALPTKRSPEILIISPEDKRELELVQGLVADSGKALNGLRKRKTELEKSTAKASDETKSRLESLKAELEEATQKHKRLKADAKKIESRGTWTMITRTLKEPRTTRVFPRGNWLDETGPEVQPAIPEFMGQLKTKAAKRATRLDLANWLTDNKSDNGKLTARVLANRLWYLYLGVGISKSLDDFGGQGEAPAFPELLDNLALDFSKDWNLKRLIRQIVVSQTYQQSSATPAELKKIDPYNQLFARQSRYRLPAETIRDSALSISGLLNVEKIGGKSVKPYQPAGYYRHLNFPKRKYAHTKTSDQYRRGVYVHWQRMFLHPSLKALDAPTREECTCERTRSNTPLAALALLNDPCFVEAARVFAERIIVQSPGKEFGTRLEFAFRWALSRKPTDEEVMILKTQHEQFFDEFKKDQNAANALLAIGQATRDKTIDSSELAAWTNTARTIFNLSETISRN